MVFALPLLVAPRPAAAAPPPSTPAPKVLQAWTSTDKGLFLTFSDAADGTLSLDKDYATEKQTQFNGVSVVLFDNGALVLGTIQGTQLNALAVLAEVNSTDMTFIVGHSKSSDGKTFFDGTVNASSDLKKAFFEGTLIEIGQDPKASKTTHIELNLAVPTAAPASNPAPTSNPAGIGQ